MGGQAMKTPSGIAEEIVSKLRFADNVDQFPDLRSSITAAIQARDEAHAAEVERLKAVMASRVKFSEEWMANPNKTKPETFEEWSKWMDGWNELKLLSITSGHEIKRLKAEIELARTVIGPLSSWLEAYNSTCDYYGSGRADDTLPLMGNFPLLTFGHIRAAAAWLERQGK
jgi:hypothetical protein